MINTETNSANLAFRKVLQNPTCKTFAFDTSVIVEIIRGKEWSIDEFATSNIYVCKYASRESLPQEQTLYPTTFVQTLNGWISYIREQFYSVPDTEAVYYTIDDKDVDFWVLIPKRDFNLLRRLVELEMRVLDTFSYGNEPLYRLEFHITYRNRAYEGNIVPSKAIRLPR